MINFLRLRMVVLLLICSIVSICYADNRFDPTRPNEELVGAFSEGVHQEGLVLNAIIASTKQKTAIINGTIMHLGDVISAFKLISIDTQSVVLQDRAGKKITLQLSIVDVKRPVS